MGPDQIKELNNMLEEYVDVPRSSSLLNMRYIPTPTRRRRNSSDEGDDQQQFSSGDDGQDDEEF